MKKTIIILISILIGFTISVFAFRDGFMSINYYHLEWNWNAEPPEDCLYLSVPKDVNSAELHKIFCIKNNFRKR